MTEGLAQRAPLPHLMMYVGYLLCAVRWLKVSYFQMEGIEDDYDKEGEEEDEDEHDNNAQKSSEEETLVRCPHVLRNTVKLKPIKGTYNHRQRG